MSKIEISQTTKDVRFLKLKWLDFGLFNIAVPWPLLIVFISLCPVTLCVVLLCRVPTCWTFCVFCRFESSSHAISMSAYLREQRRELYSKSGELQGEEGERRTKWEMEGRQRESAVDSPTDGLEQWSEDGWKDSEMKEGKERWQCVKSIDRRVKKLGIWQRKKNKLDRVCDVCWTKQERKEQLEHRAKVEAGWKVEKGRP